MAESLAAAVRAAEEALKALETAPLVGDSGATARRLAAMRLRRALAALAPSRVVPATPAMEGSELEREELWAAVRHAEPLVPADEATRLRKDFDDWFMEHTTAAFASSLDAVRQDNGFSGDDEDVKELLACLKTSASGIIFDDLSIAIGAAEARR
mmetsp:Transcript_14168/g.40110  ORF Transcript_14168/g.40110 Transcript_14168/m.40110 type:complete len:155 (-) Transcript_14168:317-781(-)